MSELRWVVVDDNDPSITYHGPWVENAGFQGNQWGPVYGGSQHDVTGLQSDPPSLSYNFTGSEFQVLGTYVVQNTSRGRDPDWNCELGGFVFPRQQQNSSATGAMPLNNWPLCTGLTDTPGEKILKVSPIFPKDSSAHFYVDQIRYRPLANMTSSLSGRVTVLVEETDPALAYTGNWTRHNMDPGLMTTEQGNSVTLKFTGMSFQVPPYRPACNAHRHPIIFAGTKVTWVGLIPAGFSSVAGIGGYRVDEGLLVNFANVPSLPLEGITIYNQRLFETPELSDGVHTLTVTHNGPSDAAPLTLDYLLIANGDIDPHSNLEVAAGKAKSLSVGQIVGASVGSFAAVFFFGLGVFYFLRWKRRQARGGTRPAYEMKSAKDSRWKRGWITSRSGA
ncbi:hypothetical protein DFP72DRAFT_1059705 [Ephemerocybe angulata]|uniref:Uncharacterized protein n=1 Tax=Ephemerocybe angulata TaxID=980116 RepID=A0A8H6IFZ1_9AGAR|nr:hypothetical protein DFP72DRAFT_1059705 [Tulosesus angulatus]